MHLFDTPDEALRSRIQAELQIAGFTVKRISRTISLQTIDAEIDKHLGQAGAVILIRSDETFIQVFYRTTESKNVYLELPFLEDDESRQLSALHIADVLRVVLPRSYPETESPKTEVVRPPQKSAANALIGYLDASVLWSDLKSAPQFGVMPGLGIRIHRWFAIQLTAVLPVYPTRIDEPEGEAHIQLFGTGAWADMTPGTRRVRPLVRVGWMLWFVRAHSESDEQWKGITSAHVMTGPAVLLGLNVRLRGRVGLEGGALMSLTTSNIRYEVDDRHVATVGQPMLGAVLGVALLPGEPR